MSDHALSAGELASMAEANEAHMFDQGHVMRFVTGEKDAYNVTKPEWIKQPATKCGFQFKNKTGEVQGESDVPTVDAQLRLPKGVEIDKWDRFRLTHRLGMQMDLITEYEIKGVPKLGPSGYVCELMLAKDIVAI